MATKRNGKGPLDWTKADPNHLVTKTDFADALRVSPSKIDRLRREQPRDGKPPFQKPVSQKPLRWTVAQVRAYVAALAEWSQTNNKED